MHALLERAFYDQPANGSSFLLLCPRRYPEYSKLVVKKKVRGSSWREKGLAVNHLKHPLGSTVLCKAILACGTPVRTVCALSPQVTKPQACKDRLFDIWYFTSNPPSAPESLIDTCTSC